MLCGDGARDAAAAGRAAGVRASCWRRAASSASSSSRPPRRRGVIDAPSRLAAGGGGGAVDAADAAAAGAGRPLDARRAWRAHGAAPQLDEISEPQHAPIIIAGFGRYGQIVGRLLYANGLRADRARPRRRAGRDACAASAGRCSTATRRGWTCCAPPAPARRACWCWPSTTSTQSVDGGRAGARALPAADDRGAGAQRHALLPAARAAASTLIERETLDSALMSGRSVLELMGWRAPQRAQPGAALSPAQHRADGAHGAALRRREEADRACPSRAASSSRRSGPPSAQQPQRAAGSRRLAFTRGRCDAGAPTGRGRRLTPMAPCAQATRPVNGRRGRPSRRSASA